MLFDPGTLYALAVLVVVTGIVTRVVIGSLNRRREGGLSAGTRLARMEERISRMEEATSGLVAEFADVRARERFMTQLVESRARKDARSSGETAAPPLAAAISTGESTSPFVVQTVSAARRVTKPHD